LNKRLVLSMTSLVTIGSLAIFPTFQANAASRSGNVSVQADHTSPILASYAAEIRESTPRSDGIYHIDTQATIKRLKALHINTYYYLIWDEKTDWDDLVNEFARAAQQAGIKLVVYLVPPSESTGTRKSYPFLTDYIAWADAIAKLSLQYKNIVGWAIDDFNWNLDTFTPTYVKNMVDTAHAINPNLTFTPQLYTPYFTKDFLDNYGPYIDGVVLTFRDDPYRNTEVWSSEQAQIDTAAALAKQYHMPIVWELYASALSATPAPPSAEYVYNTTKIALDNLAQGKLAGVLEYVLPLQFDQPTQNDAYSGKAYLSFFLASGVHTNPGDYVSVTQTIHPNGSGHYALSFDTMKQGPSAPGYHYEQVLIDNQVVWQQDVGAKAANIGWENVNIDLTPYLQNKSSANLTFRLYDEKGVSNFWQNVGIDAVRGTGFTVKDGDFEEHKGWSLSNGVSDQQRHSEPNAAWSVDRSFPGFIPDVIVYDKMLDKRVYDIVRGLFADYQRND
jgi:hypothetical protein